MAPLRQQLHFDSESELDARGLEKNLRLLSSNLIVLATVTAPLGACFPPTITAIESSPVPNCRLLPCFVHPLGRCTCPQITEVSELRTPNKPPTATAPPE